MDDVIGFINILQEVFYLSGCRNEIDLPQVVVVGSQSSGKSSVLENIVGRSFLPRGPGLVTRCPLILQLSKGSNKEEYGMFQHSDVKFTDYKLITKEIEKQTDILAGNNKGICGSTIILKLTGPNFVNLTLVDLPGLTKVPIGDQPEDIEEQTKSLIMEYVERQNCIILAITAANTDLVTSESLKISRLVDPEGKRTLAVITKLDLMDKGTNAADILKGKVIPVKLGIIGVVNRSHKDIKEDKSVEDSLIHEAEFFKQHYNNMASEQGTNYLRKTVQNILIKHIKECLPQLRAKVSEMLTRCQVDLVKHGDKNLDIQTLLLDLITTYSQTYSESIKGTLDNIETTELYGGAKINRAFQDYLGNELLSMDVLEGLSDDIIRTSMKNASGASPALFVPELAFQQLAKRQIKKMREPCIRCVRLVKDELVAIAEACLKNAEIGIYPKLQCEITQGVNNLLQLEEPPTIEYVNNFIELQLEHINTAHPDFVPYKLLIQKAKEEFDADQDHMNSVNHGQTDPHVEPHVNTRRPNRLRTDKFSTKKRKIKFSDDDDCKLVQILLDAYFSIVRKVVLDTVPKAIMHFLVNKFVKKLQSHLMLRLRDHDPAKLLAEDPNIAAKRDRLRNEMIALEKANTMLQTLSLM